MRRAYNHRLLESAKRGGIKLTGRLFATTVPTVRKWLRRFQQHGSSGLAERPRASHRQARRTSREIEQQVVALRQLLPTLWARHLIRKIDLSLSHRALECLWRTHGL
jgi:transposase